MLRVLRQPHLDIDGFTFNSFPAVRQSEFQSYHEEIYSALAPGQNAVNTLARGIRWGVLTHGQFVWLDRDTYSLPKDKNPEENGSVRRFVLIPEAYLRRAEIEGMLLEVFDEWAFAQSSAERAYEVQLSAIRYEPLLDRPALPSPIVPHQDLIDGAIVVLAKTGNLSGGTSRLYTLDDEPLYEIDLEAGEALFIRDADLKHQVTPLLMSPGATWRPGQRAYRDILIVRFQPLGR